MKFWLGGMENVFIGHKEKKFQPQKKREKNKHVGNRMCVTGLEKRGQNRG